MSFFSLLILLLLLAFYWYSNQPKSFELNIINNSPEIVDQVRLFGSGVRAEKKVVGVLPGARVKISVMLDPQGELRFEVFQGLNQIDSYIESDVSQLKQYKKQLQIQANHHYIISSHF